VANTLDVLNAARLSFFENVPGAYIVQGTPQSIPNSTDTALSFTSAVSDNWNGWTSGLPTRYTVPVSGVYMLSGASCWAGNATGRRYNYLRVNGTTQVPGSAGDLDSPSTNNLVVVSSNTLYALTAGDYVEVIVNQTSGAALNTNATSAASGFISSMFLLWIHN